MRAKFVNEKFAEAGDPVADMGIGTIKQLNAIRKVLEPDDMDSMWSSVEEDKEELTLRFDAEDFYDVENFHAYDKQAYDWDSVGVHEPFQWDYYIDVILSKNEIVRNSHFSNPDIPEFDIWDEKILVNNALDKSPDEIGDIVFDDWNGYNVSMAAKLAWIKAKRKDKKEQEE